MKRYKFIAKLNHGFDISIFKVRPDKKIPTLSVNERPFQKQLLGKKASYTGTIISGDNSLTVYDQTVLLTITSLVSEMSEMETLDWTDGVTNDELDKMLRINGEYLSNISFKINTNSLIKSCRPNTKINNVSSAERKRFIEALYRLNSIDYKLESKDFPLKSALLAYLIKGRNISISLHPSISEAIKSQKSYMQIDLNHRALLSEPAKALYTYLACSTYSSNKQTSYLFSTLIEKVYQYSDSKRRFKTRLDKVVDCLKEISALNILDLEYDSQGTKVTVKRIEKKLIIE